MRRESKYRIVLRNSEGYEIGGDRECESMKEAMSRARYLASAEYAEQSESTHQAGDMAVVINQDDEVVGHVMAEVTAV